MVYLYNNKYLKFPDYKLNFLFISVKRYGLKMFKIINEILLSKEKMIVNIINHSQRNNKK